MQIADCSKMHFTSAYCMSHKMHSSALFILLHDVPEHRAGMQKASICVCHGSDALQRNTALCHFAAGLISLLKQHEHGAQLLYAAILQPPLPLSSMYRRGKAPKTKLPAIPRRIPVKHHAFVTALGQLLGRSLLSVVTVLPDPAVLLYSNEFSMHTILMVFCLLHMWDAPVLLLDAP